MKIVINLSKEDVEKIVKNYIIEQHKIHIVHNSITVVTNQNNNMEIIVEPARKAPVKIWDIGVEEE